MGSGMERRRNHLTGLCLLCEKSSWLFFFPVSLQQTVTIWESVSQSSETNQLPSVSDNGSYGGEGSLVFDNPCV